MNKFVKLVTLAVFGVGLALSGAACGLGDPQYEDCEVSDQFEDGDLTIRTQQYEADCGYWEQNGNYFLREGIVGGATWHYWSWVVVGQNSFAPEGWKPPHGLKPPTESDESKKWRKQHEKKTPVNKPASTKSTSKKPATGSGNQSVPKNDGTTIRKTTPRKKP